MALKGKAKRDYARQYYEKNKTTVLAKTKAYALAHPEVQQRSHRNRLLRDRNMSQEDYAIRLKDQGDLCAICGKVDSRALCIDHDHACCAGEKSCGLCNRGLLCDDCNKKLAAIEDSTFIKAALSYLKYWNSKGK